MDNVDQQFQEVGEVSDWRVLATGASAWFDAPSQRAGAALVRRIAELASDRPLPDLDLRTNGVHVRIGASGLTAGDVELAREISTAASDLELPANPAALQAMRLTIDALDRPAVMAFWEGALGYRRVGDDDLVDPLRRDPAVRFQDQDPPRLLRNRIHLDISRSLPQLLDGIAAAEVAGGRRPENAAEHLLADVEGNEADLVPRNPGGDRLGDDPELADWRALFGAMTFYPDSSTALAIELAEIVAGLADDAGQPLLIDLRPDGVMIDSGKDQHEDQETWGLRADFGDLARQIQAAARDLGLTADPTRLRFVQFCIDAVDIPSERAFWRAVLGYEHDPRLFLTDIYDPRRLNPVIFFQQLSAADEARRSQRDRLHLGLFVPEDQAQARIDLALASGGRIVADRPPASWTLADPEGNELDIVT